MGQNYGYETLMTELPTFMKQILHFDIKQVIFLYKYKIFKINVSNDFILIFRMELYQPYHI